MTLLLAAARLTESQLKKLQNFLGPLISSVAVDSYCGHWPDDTKGKIIKEFYKKLNERELEYTECTQVDPSEQGENQLRDALFMKFIKLGLNVSRLITDSEKDLPTIKNVGHYAMVEWERMELNRLIGEVKKVI